MFLLIDQRLLVRWNLPGRFPFLGLPVIKDHDLPQPQVHHAR